MENYPKTYWRVFWRQFWAYLKEFLRDEREENFPPLHCALSLLMFGAAVHSCFAGRWLVGVSGIVAIGLPLFCNLVVVIRNGCQRADWVAQEAVREAIKQEQANSLRHQDVSRSQRFPFRPSI